MRRVFKERKRIAVYVDGDEYERIERVAGGSGKVSEWSRAKLLEGIELTSNVPGSNPGRVVGAREPDFGKSAAGAPVSPRNTCPHGKERGSLCYKCDPKFGIPDIE